MDEEMAENQKKISMELTLKLEHLTWIDLPSEVYIYPVNPSRLHDYTIQRGRDDGIQWNGCKAFQSRQPRPFTTALNDALICWH